MTKEEFLLRIISYKIKIKETSITDYKTVLINYKSINNVILFQFNYSNNSFYISERIYQILKRSFVMVSDDEIEKIVKNKVIKHLHITKVDSIGICNYGYG